MSAGGLTPTRPATPEIQAMADQVKADAEAAAGQTFPKFEAISYRSQVVAGTNYFIKVDVGDGQYVHIRVLEPLPHVSPQRTPQFTSIEKGHTKDDEITYLEP
ncbi:leukocyte cysteine proteinase inhibitor 1-like [Corticium candelabrum]|uniref:leukocyte cysteine proteinase inhibitor 1-like n=1 Tax=Corticium candelabrum TaxID=121492 RepID=UPI002E25D324|nr:leukocyte cysteine proteinase inhibitor 1-like [Corticium candelabrum]